MCAFKVSDASGSHVMDCYNDDNPVENDYPLSMCCKLEEKCWDGLDNDLDGFPDCADPDCNGQFLLPPPGNPVPPQECTNSLTLQSSPYNTSGCIANYTNYGNGSVRVVWNANCEGQSPPNPVSNPTTGQGYYYCGFGRSDDPVVDPIGACCPVGTHPEKNAFGEWACVESAPCWEDCGLDFDYNFTLWYEKVFHWITPSDWCNSQIPELYNPDDLTGPPRSSACCLIAQSGTVGYFTDEDNVKIWG